MMSAASAVSSRQHPFVQRCRSVVSGRGEPGEILLDGEHLIEDAVAAGVSILGVLVTDAAHPALHALARTTTPIYIGASDVLQAASPVRTPSGIVAIASWQPRAAETLLDQPDALLIGTIGVQDPGNAGSIVRSADALGATGVVVLDGSADPAGWKALRGAMGSTFRLPVGVGTTEATLRHARARRMTVVATVASGGTWFDVRPVSRPALILIGSEGAGLPADVAEAADVRVTVPMRSRVNSLNAATTAALVLWELTRGSRP